MTGGVDSLGIVGGSRETVGGSVGGGTVVGAVEVAVGLTGAEGANWLFAIRVPLSQALNATTASTSAGTYRFPIELTLGA